MRRLLLDLSPLRDSAHYRRLWAGDLFGSAASQVGVVGLPYQVYQLTHSSLAVGLIGLAALGPLLAGALFSGAISDAFDRKRLLIASQVVSLLCCVALAALAGGTPPLAALYVLAAVLAFASSIESPVRNAVLPGLIGLEKLPSALALNQIVDQVAQIAGPALAGLLIAAVGLETTYLVGVAGYGLAVLVALGLPAMRPIGHAAQPGLRAVAEGLRFARGNKPLLSTFAIDLNAMIFGMPRALFPALAQGTFGVGPTGLGLLYAAPSAGALLAALGSGWVSSVRRQGPAVIVAVCVWGTAIALFGLVPGDAFPLALALLAVAGAADVISAVFRNSIMQQETPDPMRGRMSSLHIAVVTSGPRLGDVESGLVARLVSVEFAVVSGGLACLAGVAILHLISPALSRYRRPSLPAAGGDTFATQGGKA